MSPPSIATSGSPVVGVPTIFLLTYYQQATTLQQNQNTIQAMDELDALIASPQHHKLLYENEFVRVLDTNIPPGETTNVHTHQFPSSLYILSWSHFIRYDEKGNILVDSRTLSKIPTTGSAFWSGPLAAHYLKNIGDDQLHVISVEIKK